MKKLMMIFAILISGTSAFADYASNIDRSVPYVGCNDAALTSALNKFERSLPPAVGICQSSYKTMYVANYTIDLLNSNCPATAELETYIKALIQTSSEAAMMVVTNCSPGGK